MTFNTAALALSSVVTLVACGPGLRYLQPPLDPQRTSVNEPVSEEAKPPESAVEISPEIDSPEPAEETPLASDPAASLVLDEATIAETSGALIESRRLLLQLVRSSANSVEGQEAALRLAEEAAGRQDWKRAVGWATKSVTARIAADDPEGQRRRFHTLAIAYEGQGNYEAAAAAWAEIAQIAGSDGDIQILGGQARTLLLSQRTDEALKLLETHPLDASLTEELLSGALPGDGLHALSFSEGDLGIWDGWLMLQRARQRCERGELSGCRDDATRAATSVDIDVVQGAHGLLERVRRWEEVNVRRLGLLLPLSTTSGRRAREVVELALADHDGVELVVIDSGGKPQSARDAVRELVLTHQVVGLLGPLGPRETLAATNEAARWGVPLLSLSRTHDPASVDQGVWRIRLSPQEQAAALARHCVTEQGLQRVALIYPSGTYGTLFMGAFWDELVTLGGEVRGAETYEPKSGGSEAARLVSVLAGPGKAKSSGGQDFDALLLVGRGRAGKRRMDDLRFFKEVLSHIRGRGLRIRVSPQGRGRPSPIQILGDGTWNDRWAIDMGEYLTDNALFVDGYLDDNAQRDRKRFRSRIYAHTSRRPDAFIAVAYDAANLMASRVDAISQTGHDARLALAQSLSETREFPGVTGPISLLEGGAVGRKAIMLTIDGEEIRARRTEQEEATLRQGRGGGDRN